MAVIAKLLMDEFYSMDQEALKANNFERAMAFSHCEGMVNNLHHGRQPAETLSLCRSVFAESALREGPETPAGIAYGDAVIMVDLFAEQYSLELYSPEPIPQPKPPFTTGPFGS